MALVHLQPGSIFAESFRVVQLLNTGGMGAIYEVERIGLKKRLALKIMAPEFVEHEEHRQRFMREAQVATRMESDHVVEVFDVGVDAATGTPWIAMELLRGEDLCALVQRRGRLTFAEVAGVFEHVGLGLGQAHRAGVIHLDLKPENLFVSRRHDGAPVRLKVLDFGIARLAAEHRSSAVLTSLIGSPLWMAPEQATRHGRVSPATDVWALGLIGFYLLTGKHYWQDANLEPGESLNVMALMLEIGSRPLEPASVRAAAHNLAATLPPGFDEWFARCVNRDPSSRFVDASSASSALLELADRAGVVALIPEPFASAPPARPSASHPPIVMPDVPSRSPEPPPMSGHRWRGRTVVGVMVLASVGGALLVTRSPFAPARGSSAVVRAPIETDAGAVVRRRSPIAPAANPTVGSCTRGAVFVAGGTFVMGSPDGEGRSFERPAHPVSVRAFCIDRIEVTVADYARCVRAGECQAAPGSVQWEGVTHADRRFWERWCNTVQSGRDLHPINCIDWHQATAYCRWLGGRLPTEVEWEFAARGSDGRVWPWGNETPGGARSNGADQRYESELIRRGMAVAERHAWDDGFEATAPGGSFPAGVAAVGALDLAGNVAEWTADWYLPYGATAPGRAEARAMRSIRGGGFDEGPEQQRGASRSRGEPSDRNANLGFRCAFAPR